MKLFSTFAILFIVFGCGIMNVIFAFPERYIERDVKLSEMVGTWRLTSASEADVNNFVRSFPDWSVSAPWKSFMLKSDGSCYLEIKTDWLGKFYSDLATKNSPSCSWNLVIEENMSHKISTDLEIKLEYSGNEMVTFSLYLVEENGELIAWNFIGDPDDFLPQDFVKEK